MRPVNALGFSFSQRVEFVVRVKHDGHARRISPEDLTLRLDINIPAGIDEFLELAEREKKVYFNGRSDREGLI